MNILWLAAYPHPLKLKMHPAPWLTTLAEALVNKHNIKLTIVSYNENISTDEIFIYKNIKYVFLKVNNDKVSLMLGYRDRIKRLNSYLSSIEGNFDLLHVHGSEQLYQVAGAKLKIPKVLSIQGILNECVRILPFKIDYRHLSWRVASYYENKYLKYYNNFICRTAWDSSYILKKVPNAIINTNWELMRAEFYKERNLSGSVSKKIVYAGGLDITKGILKVLEAFSMIAQETNFELVIAGSGTYSKLVKLMKSLKIKTSMYNRINFIGFLKASELCELYSGSFCLLHPSYIDNSPNTVCEAQLLGLPVIASDVGGVKSLISNNETGLLVNLSATEIVQQIKRLHNDYNLYTHISEKSRRVAMMRHNQDEITTKTISIYKQIIFA